MRTCSKIIYSIYFCWIELYNKFILFINQFYFLLITNIFIIFTEEIQFNE